jgi:hypothetical protein
MSVNRLGGYALCASALINVLQSVWYTAGGDDNVSVKVAGLVGAVLLILGLASCLPVMQRMQTEARRSGELGLALMGAAALVSLVLTLYFMAGGSTADFVSVASGASALLGLVGVLLVGSLTIRTGVFPVWAGWLLIAGGVLNFGGGLLDLGTFASAIGLINVLTFSSALMGFGLSILRKPAGLLTAGGRTRV